MNEITCISPVDGKVFATRNTLSFKDAKEKRESIGKTGSFINKTKTNKLKFD